MTLSAKKLGPAQVWILKAISESRRGSTNWTGTSPTAREALCLRKLVEMIYKGLVVTINRRHLQHSEYRITDLGLQVLMGEAFDRGLAFGFEAHAHRVGLAFETERAQVEAESLARDVAHGVRYAHSDEVEADIRAVLWANVERI